MNRVRISLLLLAVVLVAITYGGNASASSNIAGVRSATSAQNDHVFKNEDAGIQMEIPAGWKAEPEGETLTITAPDSSISIVFWALGDTSFDDATKALDQELDKILKHVKVTDPAKEDTLNGMHTVSESGTAEVDGVKLEWSLDLVKARKSVIILAFAAPDAMEKHADQLVKFIKSIKRIPA